MSRDRINIFVISLVHIPAISLKSPSLGAVCKQSKSLGADNIFECGVLSAEQEDPIYTDDQG